MSRRRRKRQRNNHQVAQQITEQTNMSSSTQEDQYWGGGSSEEDHLWRSLSGSGFAQKDVLPSTYLEIHESCYEAYNANPLAFAIIELTTSFVLGEGVTVSANNKRVQAIIDQFWDNPENRMEERVYSLCTELALYGEQFLQFFVNQFDGSVIIRQIDPSLVDEIETDPEDVEKPLRYHRRPVMPPISEVPGTMQRINNPDIQGTWLAAGKEVQHFTINKVSNAKRGKSDLATLLPWLRRYKDWLTDRVRINKYKTAFLWDVSVSGADAKTLKAKKMEYAYPPDPGQVIIHDDKEKWAAVEPKVAANDVSADGRAIKLMVAVGALVPEHYLSDGDYGNRATASEMSLPTLLKFKRRQRIVKYMLTCILDRVIEEARKAGKLGPRVDTSFEIIFPEIDSTDNRELAQASSSIISALSKAKSQGWISDETAMKIMFEFCGEEIDVHEEQSKIKAQAPTVPPERTVDKEDPLPELAKLNGNARYS